MSNNKELIRDMLNSIIKGDMESANKQFSDVSYAFSQSALGIKKDDVDVDTNTDDKDDVTDEE